MNTLTKQIIGAIIGAAAGLFVAQVVVDYIEYVNEPLEEPEDWLDGDEEDFEPGEEKKVMFKHDKNAKIGKVKKVTKNYTQYFSQQGRPDLAALAAKYNGEELEVPTTTQDEIGGIARPLEEGEFEYPNSIDEEEFEIDPNEPSDENGPIVITMEEYAEDDEHVKVTIHYYDVDDIVADEYDNPIDRPEKILGDDALVSFGEMSNDEDVVYVRNNDKNAMYEVVRLNKAFSSVAAGTRRANARRQALSKRVEKEEEDGEEQDT
jgi:hypothetical protein